MSSPWVAALGVVAVSVGSACSGAPAAPVLTREVSWASRGIWLQTDLHVHTRFSDGAYTVEDVVARAERLGVHVIAITDHLDEELKAATAENFAAIDAARRAHPAMVIVTGAEWNLPPWDGDEHAVVLVPSGADESLAAFKTQFDDFERGTHDPSRAVEGLRWLETHAARNATRPVVFYEHPSRRADRSLDRADAMKAWRAVNDLVIGFSGAPGHQGKAPFGSYKRKEAPIDRWDPVAARVGDAWDTLLGSGLDVWGAHAPSDFHNDAAADLGDLLPGQFSATWVYAPERSIDGVLRALRAGTFFGSHGHIAEKVEIGVGAEQLPRAAIAGETVTSPRGAALRVTLRYDTPSNRGTPGRIDLVELIGIDRLGARVLLSQAPAAGSEALVHETPAPEGGIVFRARGYQRQPDGSRLAFYTNPVRVVVP